MTKRRLGGGEPRQCATSMAALCKNGLIISPRLYQAPDERETRALGNYARLCDASLTKM
jgi:hypothetical protein